MENELKKYGTILYYYTGKGEDDAKPRGSKRDKGCSPAGTNALTVSADSAALEPSEGGSKP